MKKLPTSSYNSFGNVLSANSPSLFLCGRRPVDRANLPCVSSRCPTQPPARGDAQLRSFGLWGKEIGSGVRQGTGLRRTGAPCRRLATEGNLAPRHLDSGSRRALEKFGATIFTKSAREWGLLKATLMPPGTTQSSALEDGGLL